MTAKNGGSGFDADKFRKLVRMFDSPYTEEAVTAFRLAVAELKKKQLRFCDRLVDSGEARELAEIECAKVRDELTRVLDQCARREADVDDAHEIIDRLHERIAAMEKRAGARAKKYGRKESAEDLETVAPPPEETELDASDYWESAPPPPMTAPPDETPGHENYRLPALPLWKSAYWLGLLSFVVMYAGAVAGLGHMLTTLEWQAENLITDGALLFAVVTTLYVMGWKCGFSQTHVGQWCVRNFGSVGDMLAGLLLLDFAGTMAYVFGVPNGFARFDEIYLALSSVLMVVVFVYYFGHLMRKFGWIGVGIKALMWVDFWCISVSLALGEIPWWNTFHHPPITHEHGINALYFSIVWGLFCIFDTPTRWAIEHKKVREIVTLPALFFLSYGAVMVADYKVEGHKTQPAAIEHAQPSHAKPKRGALSVAPPHSPVLLSTALLTPQRYTYQPYRYQPYSYPQSNAEIVRGWGHDLKSFFDDLLGKEIEEWIMGLIALRWLWKVSQNAKDRRIKRKAIERALNPPMPRNIHGDAGFVDRNRAKRQGWI
jgi:hypothetical protein